jgi:hypothetical protein
MNAADLILLFGMLLAITMAVVVGVCVGRRRVGDCLIIFTPLLVFAAADLLPSPSATKTQLLVVGLVAVLISCTVFLFITKWLRHRRRPSV